MSTPPTIALRVGRYALYDEIAAGGMATVHLGRLLGAAGFARTVAIKRLHPQLARDAEFAATLLDEARLAARIHHPNVVTTLDVVSQGGELFVVMEYVKGESLSALLRAQRQGVSLPLGVVLSVVEGALAGLHAAHEALDERGAPLEIVHRDVSPQNIFVGEDGVARVLDFGIAKAVGRHQQTAQGVIKGKLGYMAPEQVRGEGLDRRADVYAAGVVLWESLTGRRLFRAESDWATAQRIFSGVREPPSLYRPEVPAALDDLVLKACHVDPAQRFATAEEMAAAIESLRLSASPRDVRTFLASRCGERMAERAARVAAIEQASLAEPLDERASLPDAAPPPPTTPAAEAPARPVPVETLSSLGTDVSLVRPARRPPLLLLAGAAALAASLVAVALLRGREGSAADASASLASASLAAPTAPAPAASSSASPASSAPSAPPASSEPPLGSPAAPVAGSSDPSSRASAQPARAASPPSKGGAAPRARGLFDNRH